MRYFLLLIVATSLFSKDTTGLERYGDIVEETIKNSSGVRAKILQNALSMVKDKKIVVGSCWDYINSVYIISGAKREVIFNSKKNGPYINRDKIRPADWLYHINYSYHNVGHSGLFINWVDKNETKALMLSYAGESKKLPARFRVYNIKSTYSITRAKGADMSYISIKEYAIKNKISIFNVMKLAKSGKVDTVTKEIDGKEQLFIKEDVKVTLTQTPKKEPTLKELMQEIEKLKARVEELEKQLKIK